MIVSFGDSATEDLYNGVKSRYARRFPKEIVSAALRKLDMVNAVSILDDLKSPPGNRLETLRGKWRGFHSIRVNKQWRIVFRWSDGQAHGVRLIDYH